MTATTSRANALRTHLDLTRPDWRTELRADLDILQPGWHSFPVRIWNETSGEWEDVVLLANPESVSPPFLGRLTRLARWLGLR